IWKDYYEVIKNPISMAHIRQIMNASAAKTYSSLEQFRDDWHLMFQNACTYNQDDSQIYEDAIELRAVFDSKLADMAQEYGYSLDTSLLTVYE
ncbi:Bromodomain-containing protein, partial [Dendrothele bispora CBS 962.96]